MRWWHRRIILYKYVLKQTIISYLILVKHRDSTVDSCSLVDTKMTDVRLTAGNTWGTTLLFTVTQYTRHSYTQYTRTLSTLSTLVHSVHSSLVHSVHSSLVHSVHSSLWLPATLGARLFSSPSLSTVWSNCENYIHRLLWSLISFKVTLSVKCSQTEITFHFNFSSCPISWSMSWHHWSTSTLIGQSSHGHH